MARRERREGGSTERSFAMLDGLSEAVVVADQAGRIVYANGACASVLGWQPQQLVGAPLTQVVPERLRSTHVAAFARRVTFDEGRLVGTPIQVPARRPDGTEVTADLLISVVGKGDERLLVGTLRPASAPAELDPEAILSQALLLVLSEHRELHGATSEVLAALGRTLGWEVAALWVVDPATEQLRCSAFWSDHDVDRFESATRATLFPPGVGLPGRVWEEGQAAWIEDLSTDPNFPRARAAAAAGLRSGIAFPVTAAGRVLGVMECFHRQPRTLDTTLLAAMVGLGSLIGAFLDRGRDEEERARLLDEIQHERGRLEAVLRQLPLGVVISDADGVVALANDVVERLLGPPGADRRYRIPQADGATVPLRAGIVVSDEEVEVRRADGTTSVVSVSAVPVHDRQGHVVSSVTTVVDVTERRAERARFELLAEAGEILARSLEIEETLAAIAHVSVPRLADHCSVDLLEPDGRIRRVAVAVDRGALAGAPPMEEGYTRDLERREGVSRVIRTGETVVYRGITDEQLRATARDEAHLALLRALGLNAVVMVPLVGRGRTLGALTYISFRPDRQFSDKEIDLAEELGRRAGLAITNAQLYERSRQVANALQLSLLPPRLPEVDGLDLGACFLPGGEGLIVGGDFYDVYALDDGRWALTIGDVCGTGAEAAAMTARVRYTARAAQERHSPGELLSRLNEVIRADADAQTRFCTVAHGVLDIGPDSVTATVGSGGHPPPVVVRCDGEITELRCRGTLLGVFDDVRHVESRAVLHPGDALVLFTDGVIEARGEGGLFGDGGLHEVLRATIGRGAGEIASAVGEAVLRHGAGETSDDVAVLVARAMSRPTA